MKIGINELRSVVREIVQEAKTKKNKRDQQRVAVKPTGYAYAEAFDFSQPLGVWNRLKVQGATSFGPTTSAPEFQSIKEFPGRWSQALAITTEDLKENSLRALVQDVIREEFEGEPWEALSEISDPGKRTVWTEALHWYDFQKRGLGKPKKAKK